MFRLEFWIDDSESKAPADLIIEVDRHGEILTADAFCPVLDRFVNCMKHIKDDGRWLTKIKAKFEEHQDTSKRVSRDDFDKDTLAGRIA